MSALDQQRRRDLKLFRKTSSNDETNVSGLTQLRLAQDTQNGRLSLEKGRTPDRRIKKKLFLREKLANRNPLAVPKKLKFLTGAAIEEQLAKSAKLAKSKTISKKPTTKFQEFRLSHSKPRVCGGGRRALLEDLYKSSDKTAISLLSKRPKLGALPKIESARPAQATSTMMPEQKDPVCRRLFK